MSVQKMRDAVVKQKIRDLHNTIFVQKWVHIPSDIKKLIDNLDGLSSEELSSVNKYLFAARYRKVHDLAFALNEIVETNNGDMEMIITKECEWSGYFNATEKPLTAVLTVGTKVNMLEFLEAPHEGFIFQITLGDGPKGKHFNVNMDDALPHIELLVTLINRAYNERLIDKQLGIDEDFYFGEITDEVRAELEAKHGEIKEFVPRPPLEEHEKMEITEVDADGAE